MFKKGFRRIKFTALAVSLCMLAIGMREKGTVASADGQKIYYWPVPSSSSIAKEYSETYDGIDIVSDGKAYQVVSTRDGRVVEACSKACKHTNNYPNYCCNNGLGNYVKIEHRDGTYASYSHLKYGSVTVAEGDEVEAGQVIGLMGASGRAKEVMLHFSIAESSTKTINTNPTVIKYTYSEPDSTVSSSEENNELKMIIEVESGVNFRSGAGTSFSKIGKLEQGTVVTIEEEIEIDGLHWGKTTIEEKTGWFALKYAKEYESDSLDKEESIDDRENISVRCQLILDSNGGKCKYSCFMYTKGSKIGELPVPTRSGYKFVGWYTDKNQGYAINSQDCISEDVIVYARWASNGIHK